MKRSKNVCLFVLAVMLLFTLTCTGTDVNAATKFPKKYDLRTKGLVTPVKKQDPFGSCWAFGGVAAAESSILKAKKTTYNKSKLDISERHVAYFALHPIQKNEEKSQAGEGIYRFKSKKNEEFDMGGQSIYVTSLFATGTGPIEEKIFPYRGRKGLTEYDYNVKNKKSIIAEKTKSCQAAYEASKDVYGVSTYREYTEKMHESYPDLVTGVYDTAAEEAAAIYAGQLEESKNPYNNTFSNKDDWSIPLKYLGSPTRMLFSEMTLKHGNRLPEYSIKTKKGKWKKINPKGTKAVKSELRKGRAVTMSICADQSMPGQSGEGQYLNENTWAHYTYKNEDSNHVVCVVGWDDNYSKKNFNSKHRPPGNGAWIVKNSWGSELSNSIVKSPGGQKLGLAKWGVKNSAGKHTGYFYVSYYDKSISQPETMVFNKDFANDNGFYCEQYDFMPALAYHDMTSKKKMKVANVFTAEGKSKLHSLSTNTPAANTKVKFEIYKLKKNTKNPVRGKKVRTFTKKYTYAGYHRVNLKKKIKMKKGQRFSVVVTQTYKNSKKKKVYGYSVAAGPGKKTAKMASLEVYTKAVVNKGESYIYKSGRWKDWKVYKASKKVKKALTNKYGPGAQLDNFQIKTFLVK